MDKLLKAEILDLSPEVNSSEFKSSQLNKNDRDDDYKELAKELKKMIDDLGYKSSAWVVDSRKMFK